MRILAVNSAADRLGGAEDLLHDAGELAGHRAGPHDAGGVDDIIHGDVPAVLDVLDLLPVPWRLLEGLDDEGGSRRNHGASGLPVLDLELDSHLQTFPVSGSLGNVVTNLLGRQTKGSNLGGREEVAPTSPPTALR
eukprot:TRINITY_DN148_c0_g1_i11.p2 TRINITY_DN148_c0_g1~~TRINITY_DN148_c0_g1_i11.p2  ORF type:complete len:136 (+),score=34.65 TRINITY_DN148_c0_g1_i11:81-488(+)